MLRDREVASNLVDQQPVQAAADLECQKTFPVHPSFDHRVDLFAVNQRGAALLSAAIAC